MTGMRRSCAIAISGLIASISLSRLAPSIICGLVKAFSMSITSSAGRSPKPIFKPKPRCLKNSLSLWDAASVMKLYPLWLGRVRPPHVTGEGAAHAGACGRRAHYASVGASLLPFGDICSGDRLDRQDLVFRQRLAIELVGNHFGCFQSCPRRDLR